MLERYTRLYKLCNSIIGTDHRILRKQIKAELTRQINCIMAYTSCNQDCPRCLFYGEGWGPLKALVSRINTDITPNIPIVEEFTLYMQGHLPCTTNIKSGGCNGNCSSCGL